MVQRDFCLQRTEVTQGQWRALMGSNPSHFSACGDDCPVANVNGYDAAGYLNALSRRDGLEACYQLSRCRRDFGEGLTCASVRSAGSDCEGYRLPTGDEWQHAVRSGQTRVTARDLDRIAWHG